MDQSDLGRLGSRPDRGARALAAQKLGLSEVPVIVLGHLSETQRRALVIADNQLALNSGWDEDLLRLELRALEAEDFNLDLVGFSDEELSELLRDPEEVVPGRTDEDAAPELQETAVSAVGDLWVLGPHRVLCGDATAPADVERLMGGESADLVFTDPPYNVDYEGYTEERLKIQGDRMSDASFKQFLEATWFFPPHSQGGCLTLRVPSVVIPARVPDCLGGSWVRGPLSDHLGEKHICVGFRPL